MVHLKWYLVPLSHQLKRKKEKTFLGLDSSEKTFWTRTCGWLAFIVFLLYCCCLRSVALPHGAVSCSAQGVIVVFPDHTYV